MARHVAPLLLAAATLGGCTRLVDDLAFVSVEPIRFNQMPDPPSGYYFSKAGPALERWNEAAAKRGVDPATLSYRPRVLKVTFSSKTNIEELLWMNGWVTGIEVYFCWYGRLGTWLGPRAYYFGDHAVGDGTLFEVLNPPDTVGGVHHYETYVYAQGDETAYTPDSPGAFNLRGEPRDVCIHLRGGGKLSAYDSNTVVIPKEAISAAFRDGRVAVGE
jgi:hypothetical protein